MGFAQPRHRAVRIECNGVPFRGEPWITDFESPVLQNICKFHFCLYSDSSSATCFCEDRFAILTHRLIRCLTCVPDREGSVFGARTIHRQTGFHCAFHAFPPSQHHSLLVYHVQLFWLSGFFSSKSATNLQSARVSLGWHHVQPACLEFVVSRAGYSTGHLSTCWSMLSTRTPRTCRNFYSF